MAIPKVFEEIKAWDGTSGTGAEAREVIKQNFVKVNEGLTELDQKTEYNKKFISKQLDLTWTDGKYITSGGTGNDANYQATLDYLPVTAGQKLQCNISVSGTGDIVALYDVDKNYVGAVSGTNFELEIEADGYVRFSNDKRVVADPIVEWSDDTYLSVIELSVAALKAASDILFLTKNTQLDYPLVWTNGKYITNAGTGNDANYQATLDYLPVTAGQKLQCNIAVSGSGDIVALYDTDKNYIGAVSGTNFELEIEADGYVRFSNDMRMIDTPTVTNMTSSNSTLAEKINILSGRSVSVAHKNQAVPMAKLTENVVFVPSTPRIDLAYKGVVTPRKKYLAVCFDDLRDSDTSWVIPLFNKYGFRSTFNRINAGIPVAEDITKYAAVVLGGHEPGDHTITHQMYPFYSPLFNGQDPSDIDGTQTEFPTNNDLRANRGDGKNMFGKNVSANVDLGYGAPDLSAKTWATLSDADCQLIRDTFSLYKDETLLPLLDSLSNDLLGTSGNSFGSWNTDRYTAGIFTDCKTSANHEVWERICMIQYLYYKKYFGMNFDFAQWSLPGSRNSYMYFEEDGKYYYDREKTQPANDLGKMQSTLVADNAGNFVLRSWIDVLRNFGYKLTHDSLFPGRYDGNEISEFSHHLIINAHLSKKDALIYPTERTIPWYDYSAYNEAFFAGVADYAKKMYDHRVSGQSAFFQAIEAIRNVTSNGIIAGCVWDSTDTFAEKIYWEQILRYCKSVGIEVITKSEAYDIAFNHPLEVGNLIYNPDLRNTATEFLPSANVPNKPDGYYGDCSLTTDGVTGEPVLYANRIDDTCRYLHYGIPTGKLTYGCEAKGAGTIWIYALRNNTALGLQSDMLAEITVNSENYESVSQLITIKNEAIEAYNGVNEGLGNKICGIKIVYYGEIWIKNISLKK